MYFTILRTFYIQLKRKSWKQRKFISVRLHSLGVFNRKRSESENRRKSGHLSSQRNSRYMEDPSLSPSISCTSSSLNTSCASECDRVSSRGTKRTSDKIKLNQDGKFDEGSEISAQGENRPDDGVYNNISILSSCTCNEEDEIDNVPADFNARKSSKTRNTLKRITSFMRKDKSKNLSLVDTSGPASMKYSRWGISLFC